MRNEREREDGRGEKWKMRRGKVLLWLFLHSLKVLFT
jgi:hypothetical protein